MVSAELLSDEEVAIHPVRVGDVLANRWKIERKIGRGGMAAVFLARDQEQSRKVAVKVLRSAYCADPIFVARFEREARITASFEHPNIVPVYAVGQVSGRPFMVMKLLEGHTLSEQISKRKEEGGLLEGNEVLWLMKQLCDGLGYIHSKGYVHRDIKTSNLFIEPDGHLTILDLGILRDVNAQRGLTQTGALVGTPDYMAPEQALATGHVDHRADVYALGIVLFKCITGRAPFQASSGRALLQLQLTAPPPDVSKLVPELPRAVSAVVARALEKRPEARFQTAQELYQALEASYARTAPDGATTGVLIATIPAWSAHHLVLPPEPVSESTQPPENSKRRWWLIAAASAVAILAAGGAAIFALRQASPPPEPAPAMPVASVTPPATGMGRLRVVTTRDGQPFWATVRVDGVSHGETPVEIDLPPGAHTIRIEREGFQPIEQQVKLGPGDSPLMRLELTP